MTNPYRPSRAIGWVEETQGYPVGPLLIEKTYLSSLNKCGACPCLATWWKFTLEAPVEHELSFLELTGTFILKRQLVASNESGEIRYQDDTMPCRFVTWFKKSAANDLTNANLEQFFDNPENLPADSKYSNWSMGFQEHTQDEPSSLLNRWGMVSHNPSDIFDDSIIQMIYSLEGANKFRCLQENKFIPFNRVEGDTVGPITYPNYPIITLVPIYP